jgi:hypothetical protein
MPPATIRIGAILVLSSMMWLYFRIRFPDSPPTPAETAVLVAVAGLIVLVLEQIIRLVQRHWRRGR